MVDALLKGLKCTDVIEVEEIPRNSLGKIMRNSLKNQLKL